MKTFASEKNDVKGLAYELTYHRYLMNKGHVQSLFTVLSQSEYITLHSITKVSPDEKYPFQKTYLKDLADKMELSIHSVSKLVRELKERGLVIWTHDGDGSEGTYITLTESGADLMQRQEEILSEYYGGVIEKFGYDEARSLLKRLSDLEKIMNEVFIEKGAPSHETECIK